MMDSSTKLFFVGGCAATVCGAATAWIAPMASLVHFLIGAGMVGAGLTDLLEEFWKSES